MKDILQFGTPESQVLDKDDDWYFADREYVTNSMLSALNNSPLHLQKYLHEDREPDTDAQIWGKAFHCAVLEPDEFEKRFFIFNDRQIITSIDAGNPRNTKAYREWKEEELLVAHSENKAIVTVQDYDDMMFVHDKVWKIPELRNLLNISAKEKILQNEHNGIKCKIKADSIRYGDFIIDLKSTRDPANKFSKSSWRYQYHRQMAYYKDVAGVNRCFILSVEKTSPYSIGFFEVTEETIEAGRMEYNRLLEIYERDFLKGGISDFETYYLKSYI